MAEDATGEWNLGLHGLRSSPDESRPAAVVYVSFEVLAAALRLPNGVRVTAMRPRDEAWHEHGAVLRIEGEGLPWTYAGATLPLVEPVYRRASCGLVGHAEFVKFHAYEPGLIRERPPTVDGDEARTTKAGRVDASED